MDDTRGCNPSLEVNAFITSDQQWHIPAVTRVINDQAIINKIIIIGIPLTLNPLWDSFCRGAHSSGEFSTKYRTWVAHGVPLHPTPDWHFNWI